jgi:hypothetical protein
LPSDILRRLNSSSRKNKLYFGFRFSASFAANEIGVYTIFAHAKGVTMDGESFEREQRLSAVAFLGGNQTAEPSDDRLCQLIHCLMDDSLFRARFSSVSRNAKKAAR